MHADAAVNLIMQPDLAIRLIVVACQLYAVHAQVGMTPAGSIGILGVDLWQSDERAAVAGPADDLRQPAQRRFVLQDRPARHPFGAQVPQRVWDIAELPGILPEAGGIDLELHQMLHGPEHVSEQEAGPFESAEQVADQRKRTALHPTIKDGRALGLVDTPLYLGGFEIRIDFVIDAHELLRALEIGNTFS